MSTHAKLAILAALLLACAVSSHLAAAPGGAAPLSASQMAALAGGVASCKNCHDASARFDECRHTTTSDPNNCQTDMCIENEVVGNTCDLGTPAACTGTLDPEQPQVIQYVRSDTNCTWSTNKYHTWVTHYYDGGPCADCPSVSWDVSCDKTNGQCNGTLDHTNNRGEKIVCN